MSNSNRREFLGRASLLACAPLFRIFTLGNKNRDEELAEKLYQHICTSKKYISMMVLDSGNTVGFSEKVSKNLLKDYSTSEWIEPYLLHFWRNQRGIMGLSASFNRHSYNKVLYYDPTFSLEEIGNVVGCNMSEKKLINLRNIIIKNHLLSQYHWSYQDNKYYRNLSTIW